MFVRSLDLSFLLFVLIIKWSAGQVISTFGVNIVSSCLDLTFPTLADDWFSWDMISHLGGSNVEWAAGWHVGLYVFVDGWPKKGSYLRHFWPVSECLFVYFGMKTTQRAVPAKTCKTRREGRWTVRSETPKLGVRQFKARTQS